jgi:type IV pilus assembly protein PilA
MAMKNKQIGFTVVEMMVVVAILAILAMMAIPSQIERIVREEVKSAMPLADAAKEPIGETWKTSKTLPVNNAEAQLPVPEKVVSNFINKLEVVDGAIHMTFGNKARTQLSGKILSIRPAVIEESQAVPIAWVCGNAKAPDQMTIKGSNKTNVPDIYLPGICR